MPTGFGVSRIVLREEGGSGGALFYLQIEMDEFRALAEAKCESLYLDES